MTRGKVIGRLSIHLRAGDNNQSVEGAPDGRNRPNRPGTLDRRRALLAAAAAGAGLMLPARRGQAIGEHAALRFARLHLPDLPNPRPSALRRLAMEIERRTSLVTVPEPIDIRPTDNELFRYPLLVLSGDRGFAPPTEAEVVRLRRFLTYGGFLLVDSAEGRASGRFDESVRALLARALPGDLPARVPDDHVLWKSFYVLRGVAGRILAAPYLEAVERDRRLAVVYTQNDLAGALARDGFGRWEHEVLPGGDTQREQAFRFAVNVVMYAFCLDYKTEQAHIEFILKTRRQRL
jgi:Domain of unknown function (DUF4159)